MAIKIKNLHPAVISKESRDILDEYRAFRHVVRNVYANKYSAKKIDILLEGHYSKKSNIFLEALLKSVKILYNQ